MELQEIEREIKQREDYLHRCEFGLALLNSLPVSEENNTKKQLMEHEAFFLRDQLDKYYSVYAILREEQGTKDEVLLQKV